MSAERELTPEEKLLKVIQDGGRQEQAATPSAAEPAVVARSPQERPALKLKADATPPREESGKPAARAPVAATEAVSPTFVAPQQAVAAAAETEPVGATPGGEEAAEERPARAGGGRLALRHVNRVLAAVAAVLAVYVGHSLWMIRSEANAATAGLAGAGVPVFTPPEMASAGLPSLEECLAVVGTRNAFVPPAATATAAAPAAVESEFKLVGVSIDSRDEAGSMALLREKNSAATFFVKKGETIGKTDAVLLRIFPDRVVVKNQKQEIEVR